MTLHSYLTRLIWVCVLPMLLLVIVLAALRLAHLEDEDVREAASLAKNVVVTIDQHLGAHPPATGQQLQSLLDQLALHDDWAITLLDGQGKTLARRAPPGMVADAAANSPRRFVEKSAVSPWSVVVEISAWEAREPLLKASAALAAAIVIATLTTLLGGKWASRRLEKAVASLGEPHVAKDATKKPGTDIAEMSAVHRVLRESLAKRDKADAQRRESEQLFRAIFEQAAVGISIVAPNGRWLLANRKLCDITGYSLDELLTKAFQEITHPDDVEADISQAQQLLAGEVENYSLEKRYIRKDGTVCWINLTSTLALQPEGSPDYFISVIEDINATKQAKEKLRVSDIALSSMSQGILITGPDGHILSANAAFTVITGYTEAEIRGQTCNFIKGPLTDAHTVESIYHAMAHGEEFSGVILNYRKGGLAFWNELSTTPVRNEHGELTHFICLFRDVTERKLAEGELALHRENLEQLVRTRTAELDIAKTSADTANRAKSEFLATMSHELRTPLNAVVGLTELLTDSPLNRRQRDYADKIQSSAQALRALIDDILDFSKIEAGELHLEQAPFSLDAILRTTASVMGVGMHKKAVEVLFEVEPDLPDGLVGDALRLQQILLNLTGNAVKFTESGAIVVSVRCLSRDAMQVMLQFAIRDTGIGIPSEKLGPIFDVFNQATPSTNRIYGGIGLGLSISARLAHLLGGKISVDSAVAWGSEFRLEIPLALAPVDANAVLPDLPPDLRILIIDDQSLARTSLARTCSGFGWHATTADSGVAGLNELRRSAAEGNDYDLMLLDWRMPGMDGLEMLRQAYDSPDVGLAPVVLMVGTYELEQAVGASDDLYLDGIVAKPITPASLREAVSRAYAGEFTAPQPHSLKNEQRLSGMRLLVAEDNALNQEVIQQMLTHNGAEVVMVDNGLAAVSALRLLDKHFDAVLMDIQMPVMDGHTAARMIRDELGLVDLPIIAVTAFARPEDREKSRLAGMVGHMVKPLKVEELVDLVAKERRGFAGVPATPRTASATQLPGLNVDAAMETFGGDAQRYQELLHKFLAQHGGDCENARRLFHAEDAQGAQNLLHGLSGVANLLQATELARLASAAENTLMHGDLQAMAMLFDALQTAMHTLVQSIERLGALAPTT